MKNTKKLLALVLAMVMAFSLMAVTAAAAGTEEHEHVCSTETVQPRLRAFMCNYCGSGMVMLQHWMDNGVHHGIFQCTNGNCNHRNDLVERTWQE